MLGLRQVCLGAMSVGLGGVGGRSGAYMSSNKKYKIISDPKNVSKLIFDKNGLCKIYEFKNGEHNLRKLIRAIFSITIVNGILFGLQTAYPIFGSINLFSMGLVTGLGYTWLGSIQGISTRMVKQIHLHHDFETVDVTFFNAFLRQRTYRLHFSEFLDPIPSFAGFTRFQTTRFGKIWIQLGKNEFRHVEDYEDTLDHILLGKRLTNINLIHLKRKQKKIQKDK